MYGKNQTEGSVPRYVPNRSLGVSLQPYKIVICQTRKLIRLFKKKFFSKECQYITRTEEERTTLCTSFKNAEYNAGKGNNSWPLPINMIKSEVLVKWVILDQAIFEVGTFWPDLFRKWDVLTWFLLWLSINWGQPVISTTLALLLFYVAFFFSTILVINEKSWG